MASWNLKAFESFSQADHLESGQVIFHTKLDAGSKKSQISYTWRSQIIPLFMSLSYVSDIMMWPKYCNNWMYASRLKQDFWGTHCVGANLACLLVTIDRCQTSDEVSAHL